MYLIELYSRPPVLGSCLTGRSLHHGRRNSRADRQHSAFSLTRLMGRRGLEYPTLETDISDQFTMRDRASPPSMHVSVNTTGRLFRRYTRVWSEAQRGSLVGRFEFISLEAPGTKAPGDGIGITIAAWPRVLQIGSLVLAFAAGILAAAHAISAGAGLALGFFALAVMFFGNFAAYRRGIPQRLVGPSVAVIGTWGSLIVVIAIGINALV